jgi:hypothetical protein
MKITSMKEVFNDHRKDMHYIVEDLLGKTLARQLIVVLQLRRVVAVKQTIQKITSKNL